MHFKAGIQEKHRLMDYLRLYVHLNNILVISGRRVGDNERKHCNGRCNGNPVYDLQAGLKSRTAWLEINSSK